MGLSAPRRRKKFSQDPNNTTWSRSESKFGQRILQSQGWKPGEYLGTKNAPQSKHYTAASASHIKVALREENLGLGARIGAAGGEWQTTGLGGFQDLLGRLNGKSDEDIQKGQKSRSALQRKIYSERRWGGLHFISGGFLVGDRHLDGEISDEAKAEVDDTMSAKATANGEAKVEDFEMKWHDVPDESPAKDFAPGKVGDPILPENKPHPSKADRRASKNERRAARAERKLLKQLKKAARLANTQKEALPATEIPENAKIRETTSEISRSDAALPVKHEESATAPKPHSIKHVARMRSIKHKKMAMMNNKALNEILMIKG